MPLRITRILLILSVAMWGLLGAFGNIVDWGGSGGIVRPIELGWRSSPPQIPG